MNFHSNIVGDDKERAADVSIAVVDDELGAVANADESSWNESAVVGVAPFVEDMIPTSFGFRVCLNYNFIKSYRMWCAGCRAYAIGWWRGTDCACR
jgi:hypothetical protein